MMEHDDLETLLRGYRPIGPPPALRDRILNAAIPQTDLRDWLPVAAAVLCAVMFYWLADHERRVLSASMPTRPPIDDSAFVFEEPLQP
jgi:hypothetical protein